MPAASAPPTPAPSIARRAYSVIIGAAAVDAIFLVGLVAALALGSDGAVGILAPLFAFGYVYLVYLTATGATRGKWGWWYPGLVAVTAGPIGAVLGARRLRARSEAPAATPTAAPAQPRGTRKEQRKAAAEQRRASDGP
jgi:hypothetical protein